MDWTETPAELARARAEQPMLVPAADGLLRAIFTPPAPEAPLAGMCVVMPGRMRWMPVRGQVRAARTLAARGFACLRFDYHGYGESEGAPVRTDRDSPCGGDIVGAIRYLRHTRGQHTFVLWGRCFDSLSALAAFADEADAIAGLLYIAAPILETHVEDWRARNARASANGLIRRGWTALRGLRASAGEARRATPAVAPDFARYFAALVRSRARALFIYGEQDPLYEEFRAAERLLFANLGEEARGRIEVEIWPGRIHHPETVARECELLDRMQSWVETLHPHSARRRDSESCAERQSALAGARATHRARA
jgi:pimeloyl-ACP methyl ester carboxylesterase